MHDTSIFIGIVADILAIVGIFYVVFSINLAEKKQKSELTKKYERFKRETMFRNSLLILSMAFLASFFAGYGAVSHDIAVFLFPEQHDFIIELFYILGKVLLFVFIVYIIQTTKYSSMPSKKPR